MSFDRKRKLKVCKNAFCEAHGIGSLVRSLSGRTRGRIFAVVATETDAKGFLYALVCDGRTRSVSHPKRKRASHLETLAPACGKTPYATDEEIQCAIASLSADEK